MWSATEQSYEMDILDVDEELKDDSIFASEDRTHDDVCNILQQWKSNWLPTQEKEQAYKLNSKTFTRPKKKQFPNPHLQNNETQNFVGNSSSQTNQSVQRNDSVISLEIGGYVTNMHKSFLQDTSPPASICSSMDVSIDQINNSLITSADFTNISFLQQSNCLDSMQNLINNRGDETCTFSDKSSNNGYTFNDLIRDRKTLDSLTLSADGTLIKDSNIAQIDDISLALSKTTSSCSTMDNSTNSVESNNIYNVEVSNKNCTYDNNKPDIFHKTVLLNNDMISDTTFDLVQNSFVIEKAENEQNLWNVTHNLDVTQVNPNKTFKKQIALDETICLAGNANSTFDMLPEASNSRCETPENCNKATNFFISTPHINNLCPRKQQFPSSLNKADEVNISPIQGNPKLCETFEHASNNKSPDSYCGVKIENMQNSTFNKNFQCLNQSGTASKDVPNVLELANAEAELLASNGDEVQFEHMLEELSRVHMSYDQTKMKMSLNSIKKRLGSVKPSSNSKNEKDVESSSNHSNGDGSKNKDFSDTISKDSTAGNSSSTDRLLSRRSRLYDNINLSTMPDNKNNSFVINSEENSKRNIETKTQNCSTSVPLRDTDSFQENNVNLTDAHASDTTNVPLTRRERDRERFKTIKIVREHGTSQLNSNLQNLPCIDNDGTVIINNKVSEIESNKTSNYLTYKKPKEEHINRQLPNKSNTSLEAFPVTRQSSSSTQSAGQQRSLSRPRYISGLQKFSAVSKATSAGDLDISTTVANTANENMIKQKLKASGLVEKNGSGLTKELKSPMGIKSKSFHNLSFQSGYNNAGSIGVGLKNSQSKLTRPGAKTYFPTANVDRMQQPQKVDDIFKIPKVLNRPTNTKYAGLPRPSSGYYSLSIPGKGSIQYGEAAIESENDLSSESTLADSSQNISKNEAPNRAKDNRNELTETNNKLSLKPIKSATGIPKPSGIRPPSNMKRSCLPRPSSITRH